ncbi:MAG: FAD:protein FMN transferase, partial [Chloroflexota bacterium]
RTGSWLSASLPVMDTVATVRAAEAPGCAEALERALGWFVEVERVCSRFDPESELSRLCRVVGRPVHVSRLLFEAVRVALQVSRVSAGRFDPTLGAALASRGFNRHWASGQRLAAPLPPSAHHAGGPRLNIRRQTITLTAPVLIDLGAIAKGLAMDLAARELADRDAYCIDAGGDLLVRSGEGQAPWRIGIEHPRRPGALIATLKVPAGAVCTSGDYERRSGAGHHLLDPHTLEPAAGLASVTVIAARATVADALATAAFVAGPEEGPQLLREQEVDGLLVTPELEVLQTPGCARWL